MLLVIDLVSTYWWVNLAIRLGWHIVGEIGFNMLDFHKINNSKYIKKMPSDVSLMIPCVVVSYKGWHNQTAIPTRPVIIVKLSVSPVICLLGLWGLVLVSLSCDARCLPSPLSVFLVLGLFLSPLFQLRKKHWQQFILKHIDISYLGSSFVFISF